MGTYLACTACGRHHATDGICYVCDACGANGVLEFVHDLAPSSKLPVDPTGSGIWRYAPLLPGATDGAIERRLPLLFVGGTPLYHTNTLGNRCGLTRVFVKDDTRNPTGSLKDRASALVLARAAAIGAEVVSTASTGNAASSLAGLAASVGRRAVIFMPASAPVAKLTQCLVYGATVFAVDGTYDDAFDLCQTTSQQYGWFNRNTAYNPYTIEGKKTVALEIFEQLDQRAPDVVLIPTGDGCILSGVARGFDDLQRLGLINVLPRLVAVQAAGSDAISRAWLAGAEVPTRSPAPAASVADSITVDVPRNGRMALRDIRRTGGSVVTVSDEEILTSIPDLARATGVFAEPAGAAALAGFNRLAADGGLDPDDLVVLLVTGSGLKDIRAASRATSEPIHIEPSVAAVDHALDTLGVC